LADMDLIILGLLNFYPAHGYLLKKTLKESYGERYLNLGNSALYPRLARLEKEGFIEGKREPQENMPDKTIFHITDAGRSRFMELISRPFDPAADEFTVKCQAVHMGLLSREDRIKIVSPYRESKKIELKEALEKREKFGPIMEPISLAVLDNGVETIKLTIVLCDKLLQ
jgi:DNA-binding PadR family transcriptional regulator